MTGERSAPESPLYLRKLALGLMQNYVYLLGSRTSRECLVVDPAWDVDAILAAAEEDGMKIVGALATHYHPDHIGGDLFGHSIPGLGALLERVSVPIHVQRRELEGVAQVAGIPKDALVGHAAGDELELGDVRIKLLHTPGHTPGSQCFLAHGHLVSGDTLFFRGCGRVDLPGGDPEQMWKSLTQVLRRLPPETALHPGHQYGPVAASTIGEEIRENPYLNVPSLQQWLETMGQG